MDPPDFPLPLVGLSLSFYLSTMEPKAEQEAMRWGNLLRMSQFLENEVNRG